MRNYWDWWELKELGGREAPSVEMTQSILWEWSLCPLWSVLTLVVEAVEVVVPAMANRTFQVFLKAFSNLAKGVFLLRRSPQGGFRLERAQFFTLQGTEVGQGKQQGHEALCWSSS